MTFTRMTSLFQLSSQPSYQSSQRETLVRKFSCVKALGEVYNWAKHRSCKGIRLHVGEVNYQTLIKLIPITYYPVYGFFSFTNKSFLITLSKNIRTCRHFWVFAAFFKHWRFLKHWFRVASIETIKRRNNFEGYRKKLPNFLLFSSPKKLRSKQFEKSFSIFFENLLVTNDPRLRGQKSMANWL